jgi:MFS family permease
MNTQPASTADSTGSWVVAAVATAVLAVVLGVFGSVGVLIDPLADAYAAPRAQVALLFAAALAVHSLAARRAGRVLDRWGPRPLLVVAAAGITVGPLAPAAASTVGFAVAGYGVGVGLASACTWVATTGVVSATFHRRRSAALGLLTAGPAAGGVVLAPVMATLADTIGPRPTCVAVAALGFTACVTGAVLLGGHRAPTQPTSGTAIATATATTDSPEPGSRGFLLAGLLMSLVVFIPLVHIAASATRLGLSPGHGAAVLAVISATSAATRLAAGWLATPTTLRSLYRATHLLVAAAFGVWALSAQAAPFPALPMLLLVAVLFGAGYGGWLSLGPAILAATCPPSRLGHALGNLAAVVGIGGVIGPVLAAPLLETAAPAFLLGCTMAALAAATALNHRAAPRDRSARPGNLGESGRGRAGRRPHCGYPITAGGDAPPWAKRTSESPCGAGPHRVQGSG